MYINNKQINLLIEMIGTQKIPFRNHINSVQCLISNKPEVNEYYTNEEYF